MQTLGVFERTEANLLNLERLWTEIVGLLPKDYTFGDDAGYAKNVEAFLEIYNALPAMDKWKPKIELFEWSEISQMRLDAQEIGFSDAIRLVEVSIYEPAKILREYRRKFDNVRATLTRTAIKQLIASVDESISKVMSITDLTKPAEKMQSKEWISLVDLFDQLATVAGPAVRSIPRWSDLHRHVRFANVQDLIDISALDWPVIKPSLCHPKYAENEAIPVGIEDLGVLALSKPTGMVSSRLNWELLSAEDFERLVFRLICDEPGYENAAWLMKTTSPDRGRDLSVDRIVCDQLIGTSRSRAIIQCKHWLSKSVSIKDLSELLAQMALWQGPPVGDLIIATSGRFTTDAVQWVEAHNLRGVAPKIAMWPESHLERLLAARPNIIAEFRLRD